MRAAGSYTALMPRPSRWRTAVACGLFVLIAVGCVSGTGDPAPGTPAIAPSGLRARPARVVLKVRRATFALPSPVQREVAGVIGGTVYVVGGLNNSDLSVADVVALNAGKGTAHEIGTMPNAFHDAAGAVIHGRLFVFGGGTGQGSNVVQSFDPASGAGRVEGTMPQALSDLSGTVVGGIAYLVGGYDNVSPQRSIFSTTDGRHFSMAGNLPVGLRYPAVAPFGSMVVIAGGQTATGLTDEVLAFDPATGTVRTIGHLRQPTAHAAAFTLGGILYVAGGRDEEGSALAGIEAVNPTKGTVRLAAGRMPSPLADPAVVVVGNEAWLLGGWRGAPVTDVLIAALTTR